MGGCGSRRGEQRGNNTWSQRLKNKHKHITYITYEKETSGFISNVILDL